MAEYIQRSYIRKMAMLEMAYTMETETDAAVVLRMIEDAPAADVAPVVHGRWIEKSAPARKIYFERSHCGAQENKHTAIKGCYCWRCGAKMDGGTE